MYSLKIIKCKVLTIIINIKHCTQCELQVWYTRRYKTTEVLKYWLQIKVDKVISYKCWLKGD